MAWENYNTIIMARNQEIEQWKQQERLRAEKEKQYAQCYLNSWYNIAM